MRCLLALTVLVAAASAASVSQSVSVGGSSVGGETVSVAETSSSINADTGETLGIRSSFTSRRRDQPSQRKPVSVHPQPKPAPVHPQPKPAPVHPQPKPAPVHSQRKPAIVHSQRKPAAPVNTQRRKTPVHTGNRRPAPVRGAGLSGASSLAGSIPRVPAIRPLKPLNIHVPSLAPAAGTLGTRFNSRPSSAASAPVAPALAGAQAQLNKVAAELSAVMTSLGV